ncbi:MAG: hypothetical protein HYS88_01840 [Candidatus Colwellbacteria bacterium]|nr:hypothetical protein [Candidatus Colwellbacteria bacterium]
MAEEVEEKKGKVSLVEGIIMVMIVATADIVEIILTFFGLNPLSIIIDFPVTFTIQFWLWMKGSKWTWALAGNLVEFIPYVDFLPIRTATLLLTIYLSNHSKAAKSASAGGGRITLPRFLRGESSEEE